MELDFISILISLLVTYLITYIIGHILISQINSFSNFSFLKEFTKICSGFYVIITTYSIYKTKGITINLGLIILFTIMYIWLYKNKYLRRKGEFYKEIVSIQFFPYLGLQLIALIFIYVYLYLKIYDPINKTTYLTHGDFYNYAKIVEHLNRTGVESSFIDWLSGITPNRNLYHFGELWYTAFFSNILHQTPFIVFYFYLFSICLIVYFVGACSLIEISIKNKNLYIYSIFILFICGISFYIPRTTIFTRGDWWDSGLLFQPKYFFSTIYIIYAYVLYRKNLIFPLVVLGMSTILVCTVVAPAILISCSLIILFLLFTKETKVNTSIKYSVPIVITLIYIGIYTMYIHYLNKINISSSTTNVAYNSSISIYYYLKTAFNCFAGQIIKSFLSLLPYIILTVILYKKNIQLKYSIKLFIIFFLITHISSILSYSIFFNRVDAVQLWTNIYVPLSAIFCFVIIMYIININKIFTNIIVLLLVFLSLYQSPITHREAIINKKYVQDIIKKYDGNNVVFFKSENDFTCVFSKNINMYAPSPYLVMNFKSYNPICLSVFEIPISNIEILRSAEKQIISNSVFYKFIESQKKDSVFISIENSQVDFIKKYKVKYAIVYPNSKIPDLIQPYIKTEILDSIEGVRFYTLNKMY